MYWAAGLLYTLIYSVGLLSYGSASFTLPNSSKADSALASFSKDEQQILEDITTQYMETDVESIYSAVNNISLDHPFIFFHQRKAGGQSLRGTLVDAAKKMHAPYFLPCFNKVHCDTYHWPDGERYAIYGGHIQWGTQKMIVEISNQKYSPMKSEQVRSQQRQDLQMERSSRHSRKALDFSCITNIREPVSRIVSCIYFRFLANGRYKWKNGCINQLTIPGKVRLALSYIFHGLPNVARV